MCWGNGWVSDPSRFFLVPRYEPSPSLPCISPLPGTDANIPSTDQFRLVPIRSRRRLFQQAAFAGRFINSHPVTLGRVRDLEQA